ncbi:hypothetical protein PG989_004291 [Apiospora arundinis]
MCSIQLSLRHWMRQAEALPEWQAILEAAFRNSSLQARPSCAVGRAKTTCTYKRGVVGCRNRSQKEQQQRSTNAAGENGGRPEFKDFAKHLNPLEAFGNAYGSVPGGIVTMDAVESSDELDGCVSCYHL